LPVSFFGGMAPVGMLGMFSAIKSIFAKIVFRPSVSIPYSCPPGGVSSRAFVDGTASTRRFRSHKSIARVGQSVDHFVEVILEAS
jgi:hypothetical protein